MHTFEYETNVLILLYHTRTTIMKLDCYIIERTINLKQIQCIGNMRKLGFRSERWESGQFNSFHHRFSNTIVPVEVGAHLRFNKITA